MTNDDEAVVTSVMLDTARLCMDFPTGVGQPDRVTPLREAILIYPDIAAAFVRLHVHESRHAEDTAAMLMLAALLKDDAFTEVQRRRSARAAIAETRRYLRDASISDTVKFTLLPLLVMAGEPTDPGSVGGYFRNYAAAAKGYRLDFAESLSDEPARFVKLLRLNGFLSEEVEDGAFPPPGEVEKLLHLVDTVADDSPVAATLIAAALVYRAGAPDFDHARAPEQLDALFDLGTPRARWCLETLANWPGFALPFRNRAARLAAELAARGVAREAPPAPGEFAACVVSIDGTGLRSAALFHQTPDDGLDAVVVMLDDESGVLEVMTFFGAGEDVLETLRAGQAEAPMLNASLPLLRELLARAFAVHGALGTAPPGALFPVLAYLGDEPIAQTTMTEEK